MFGTNWLRERLIADELRRLRAVQAQRAMPIVSQIVEYWDQVPNDERQVICETQPGLVGALIALQTVMEM